jgi:hypothetical protein
LICPFSTETEQKKAGNFDVGGSNKDEQKKIENDETMLSPNGKRLAAN